MSRGARRIAPRLRNPRLECEARDQLQLLPRVAREGVGRQAQALGSFGGSRRAVLDAPERRLELRDSDTLLARRRLETQAEVRSGPALAERSPTRN
jgi:hypothetical protein